MNQIRPYSLWLGHAGHFQDFRKIFDTGIQAVLYLAMEEAPVTPPRELISCRFPLLDSTGNRPEILYLAMNTLATLLRLNLPTLVCCSNGMSRTPALTAGALAMISHDPPEVCLQRVVQHHPSDVSPGFWKEVTGLLPSLRG
ncbi:MAG: protein tyrosine phosphatase [Planctomycetes bacterium]|nr:protein tyrosine phosphatase [Planctomycetota bacterium]